MNYKDLREIIDKENRQYVLCNRAFLEAQRILKQANPDTNRLSEILEILGENPEGTEALWEVHSFRVEQMYQGIERCLSAAIPKHLKPIAVIGGNGMKNLLQIDERGNYHIMPYMAGGN